MELEVVKSILNYQFGYKVGDKVLEEFKKDIKIEISKNTGRIRRIYIKDNLFGTVEPSTGFIILKYYGASIIKRYLPFPKYRIIIDETAREFILKKRSLFSKFIKFADENILPNDVVFIVDVSDELLAVGISVLSAREMLEFKRGIAVKIKDVRKNTH